MHHKGAQTCRLSARLIVLTCALCGVLQSGCTDPAANPVANLTQINPGQIHPGMTRQEVLAALGPPQRQEIYGTTEFLIYSTDGNTDSAQSNFLPVAIVDGRVTGTGRAFYEAIVQASNRGGQGG
jgi:outer membrane protein assembly factor BamE (lipoprotein component of BamABCDE complex)